MPVLLALAGIRAGALPGAECGFVILCTVCDGVLSEV